MALGNNNLVQVQTYQRAMLAVLRNNYAYIEKMNTMFKNPQDFSGNLGDTIDYSLPVRQVARPGLSVSQFDGITQRKRSLAVDQAYHVANAFATKERIFNVEGPKTKEFMKDFGEVAIVELGDTIEGNVALNNVNNTYRVFDGGASDITSFQQLAQAAANYRNIGAPKANLCGIIPDIKNPAIIGTGLNQFVLDRNEKQYNSWELGEFARVDWYSSNLCPIHIAGSVGQAGTTLTVVSINAAGTQLTLSGASNSDPDAIKKNDVLTFQDSGGVVRFLTQNGHQVSQQPVQVAAVSDVGSDGTGQVVVDITPALISTPDTAERNISTDIVAGMELTVTNSHIAGILFYQPAFMLGMPQLPDKDPFTTGNAYDPETGISMRMSVGSSFEEDRKGTIWDVIWGSDLVPEYAMRLAFAL